MAPIGDRPPVVGGVAVVAPSVINRRARGQSGFGLLEVVIAVAVVATAVLGLLAALLTVQQTSEGHRKSVRASLRAVELSEQVDRALYQPCATTQYNAIVQAAGPAGYTASVESIQYLVDGNAATASFTPTPCVNANADQGVQKIVVRIDAAGPFGGTERVTIVKRDNRCQAGAPVAAGATC